MKSRSASDAGEPPADRARHVHVRLAVVHAAYPDEVVSAPVIPSFDEALPRRLASSIAASLDLFDCGISRRVRFVAHQSPFSDTVRGPGLGPDRKSTRLNSSHLVISYAVFCLKQKKLRGADRIRGHLPPDRSAVHGGPEQSGPAAVGRQPRPDRLLVLPAPGVRLFFFRDPATTELYTLSLHDALPIYQCNDRLSVGRRRRRPHSALRDRNYRHADRKSTRLNSSHLVISYAVFCLK